MKREGSRDFKRMMMYETIARQCCSVLWLLAAGQWTVDSTGQEPPGFLIFVLFGASYHLQTMLKCFFYVILDETARRTTGSAEELKLCLSEDLTALVSARQVGKTESPTTATSEIDGAGSWTGCQNTDTTIDCSVIMSANGTGSGPPHWFRNTWSSR